MDAVNQNSKKYDLLFNEFNPLYSKMVDAIAIVKDFIRARKLIIYGGTAIDMALRLKGQKIYPDEMLKIADLDFFSPDSVRDAYDLCDILYKAGFGEVRTIHGLHIQTMRVDIINNTWIADISYCPKNIFDIIEVLNFDGMKIVHPSFQRIDVHKSLSFPYDNPPREVVFNRYAKDVKRFNILDENYPITGTSSCKSKHANANAHANAKTATVKVAIGISAIRNAVFHGLLAYSVMYDWFARTHNGLEIAGVIPATVVAEGENIIFDGLSRTVDLVHMNPDEFATELALTEIVRNYPNFNFTPAIYRGKLSSALEVAIHSSHNRLITVFSAQIGAQHYRVVNCHYVLLYFIANAILATSAELKQAYFAYYNSLLIMIRAHSDSVDKQLTTYFGDKIPPAHTLLRDDRTKTLFSNPLFIGSAYYGSQNHSEVYEILSYKLKINLSGGVQMIEPKGYTPEKFKDKPRPTFNYADSHYFAEDGAQF